MSQHLPVSHFEWCPPTRELLDSILTQADDASLGYMIECDLTVPDHLHDLLNDYPPAPEEDDHQRGDALPIPTRPDEEYVDHRTILT